MLYILVVKWDTIVHSQHLMGNMQIYISFTQKQKKAIWHLQLMISTLIS